MKTLLVAFIFAVAAVSIGFSMPKGDSPMMTSPVITTNDYRNAIKMYLQTGAKLIGVSDASVKKVIEIIDIELPESVFGPLFNQTRGVVERIVNRIGTAAFIDKSIPSADVDILRSQEKKVIDALTGLFVKNNGSITPPSPSRHT